MKVGGHEGIVIGGVGGDDMATANNGLALIRSLGLGHGHTAAHTELHARLLLELGSGG